MLIYYDDYIIVSKDTVSYGPKWFNIRGKISKIYVVDNIVLLCCGKIAYVFCRNTKLYECIPLPDSFVVNRLKGKLFIIDLKELLLGSMMKSTMIEINSWHRLSCMSCVYIRGCVLQDDLPTTLLRTEVARSFRGFEDLVVIAE